MAKAKNEAKIKFLADTQGFRDGVKDANASLAELSSELKLNAAQMKTSGKSTEKLAERKEILESQLEQASKKTENLSAQMESCTRNYGENSDEAKKLAIQINNAKSAEERIRQEINNVTGELKSQAAASVDNRGAMEKLEDTISDQESALDDLKKEYMDVALEYGTNSKEAKGLAKQIKDLSGDLNKNRGTMSKAERAADNLADEVDDAGDAARDASDGFTVWKGTLADLASSGIQGAMSGIGNLAGTFWNLGDETRELRTNMAKVETAFESAGFTTDQAADTYEHFYGILGDEGQATEAASLLSKLAKNEDQLAEYTQIATGVYAEFGDSLPIEGLIEAANETAKTGTVTGSLADALNWSTMSSEEWVEAFNGHPRALKRFQRAMKQGLTVEEAFNEALTQCNQEWEKEQVIRQALNGLYGDAAAAYAENNAEIIAANKAQSRYNNALGGLGEIIEPIKTVFVNGMAGMLESVTEFMSGLDAEAIKSMISSAFDYINNTVFPAIKTGIDWFVDNKDLVIGGITAIAAGIAAFKVVSIISGAVSAFKNFKTAISGASGAFQVLNVVMKGNLIGIVISAIVALVAGFIYLWNNCEGFRNFWIGLWENIKYYAGIALDWLVNFFTVTLPEAWDNFKAYAGEVWNNIWTTVSTAALNIWTDVTTWFDSMWASLTEIVSGIWTDVTTWFDDIWTKLTEIVSGIWTDVSTWFINLWTMLSDTASSIWTDVTTWFSNVKNDVVSTVSALWTDVSTWFINLWDMLTSTVTSIWTDITTWFTNIKNDVVGTVSALWTDVSTWFINLWDMLTSTVTSIWTDVTTWFTNIKENVGGTAAAIWTDVSTWFISLWDTLTGTVSGIWSDVTSKFTAIKDGVTKTAQELWNSVSSKFSSLWTSAVTIWNGIKTSISGVWGNITKGVTDAVGKVRTKVTSVFNSVRTVVSSIWDGIKGKISDVWDGIKSGVTDKINSVRSKIITVFNGVKATVTSVWNNIKSAIEDPINTAKSTVESVISKIKDVFNFDWSLPKIKLPHFTVSGGKAPWGFMGEGSLPSVSIDWYAKGAVLKAPTIFGMDKQGRLMGGGEAGAEAVAPIDVLLGYVRTAVTEVMSGMTFALDDVAPSHVDKLETYVNSSNGDLSGLIDAIADLANRPINLDIDGMRFATATAGASDNVSGNRLNLRNRGLAMR